MPEKGLTPQQQKVKEAMLANHRKMFLDHGRTPIKLATRMGSSGEAYWTVKREEGAYKTSQRFCASQKTT